MNGIGTEQGTLYNDSKPTNCVHGPSRNGQIRRRTSWVTALQRHVLAHAPLSSPSATGTLPTTPAPRTKSTAQPKRLTEAVRMPSFEAIPMIVEYRLLRSGRRASLRARHKLVKPGGRSSQVESPVNRRAKVLPANLLFDFLWLVTRARHARSRPD